MLLFGIALPGFSQEFVWKAGVHSFFDNTEFAGSKVQTSQTMAGVHVAPEFGLRWGEKHRIFAGVDLLHEYGSNQAIDYCNPVAYYEYDGKPFRFYMGAFPRKLALEKYPRMFFQDSVANYRPSVNGLFWELYADRNYLNVWIDWTVRQTEEQNEAFFMGWSGKYHLGLFYAQHFFYLFHFSAKKNTVVHEGPYFKRSIADFVTMHDNGLMLTSLGIDVASQTNFAQLEANVGWSLVLERDRSIGDWRRPQGLLSEIKVEYKGVGIFNTCYWGGSQQIFYKDHGNHLYWGDPVYRSKTYNRTDLSVFFVKTNVCNVKFVYSLHLVEKSGYHEQSLYATFDLDNLQKKAPKNYQYLWSNWFIK